MAQRFNRVAAGVCAVVAIAVAGGAGAAVTSADPGGPRSPSGHSRDDAQSVRHGDGHPGQGHRPRGGGHGGTGVKGRDARDARAAHQGPGRTTLRGHRGDDAPSVIAGRGGATALAPAAIAARPGAAEPGRPSALPDEPATSARNGDAGGGGGGSGAQVSASVVLPTAPKVPEMILGDGRSPAFVSAGPVEIPARVAPAPLPVRAPAPLPASAPPAPAPAPASSPALRAAHPHDWSLPVMPVTASLWGKAEQGWPAGVLFGLAGLVLAPIAGMWLGLRQARASNSASLLTAS